MVSNTILLAGILAAGVLQGVKCNTGTSQNKPTYEKEHPANVASHGQSGYENYGPTKAKGHDVNIPTQGTHGNYGADVYDPLHEHHNYGSPASSGYPRGHRGAPTNVENLNIPNQGLDSYVSHGESANYKYLPSVPAYGHDSYGHYTVVPSYVPGDYENQGVFRRGESVSQVPDYGQGYADYGNYGDFGGRIPLPYYGGDSYGVYDHGGYGGYDTFGQGGWFPFNNQRGLVPNFGYGGYGEQFYPVINGGYGGYGQGSLYPLAYHGVRGNVGQGQRGPYSGYNGYGARLPYGAFHGYASYGNRVLPHHRYGGIGPIPVYAQYPA